MIICREAVLTENEARMLVASDDQSFIGFKRLTSMSAEVAGILAFYDGCLCLSSLVDDLPEDVAAALAKHKGQGGVILSGLTRLLPGTVAALADYKGGIINLDGVTSLSDEAAAELGKYLGRAKVSLHLCGLTSLSDSAAVWLAKYLGRFESSLYLDGLTSLSVRAARELAKCQGILQLQGVARPSEEVLAILESSPAISVVLNDKHKDFRKNDAVPANYTEQVSRSLGINMILVDCKKANPNSTGHVCLCSIEQLPAELTAMYFAHIFGDHSIQYNDRWQFKRYKAR